MNTIVIMAGLLLGALIQNAEAGQRAGQPASNLVIDGFDAQNERTIEVIRRLAEQSHTVIGVSGEIVGSDSKKISISVKQTSLKAVLDEICAQDPRFNWKDREDHNLEVIVNRRPVALVDVVVRQVSISAQTRIAIAGIVRELPEVKHWAQDADCRIGTILAMGPSSDVWTVEIDANNKPVWKILNDIAFQSKTCFWSVIKLSATPCVINVFP
jgi:hypothetical protein